MPSREFVLKVLADAGAPLEVDVLVQMLDITPPERAFFERRLGAMSREGELMINRKGAVCLPEKISLVAGRVQGHPEGFGFVVTDEPGNDFYLSQREMEKVLHGDRVLVRESGVDRRGRKEATIVEVTERANSTLVGRLIAEQGVFIVAAEDKRIARDILVPPHETGGAKPGQVVVVALIQQPERHVQPLGRVVEIVGDYGDPGMEIEIALRKHNLPHVFSDAARAQAEATSQKVGKKELKPVQGVEREDLRDLPLVTIDGETARDFDDAVYAEKKGKGWRLVVAIADVSHYVTPGDALDATAIERGNSVYFPRRVIPMLPEEISNGICSLNPAVDRLCMVCDMNVGASGKIKKYRFYPAVMHSKARLTYNKVWDMIENPKGDNAKQYKKVLPHINTLYDLFKAFAAARGKRGAIDFETTETEIRFDDNGKIREIVPVVRNDAHKLIEECMLAANVCAADILIKNKHPSLFRVHEGPTPEKLDKLREYLRSCGLTLEGGESPQAADYSAVMAQIKQRPDMPLLQTMLLRSLQQAVYSPDNKGHFGLGYEAYTHFTSPIRRYPDLLVHRSIKAILAGKKYKPAQKWDALGVQCSVTERRADEASRDVLNFLKCYFMQDKVGEVFEGSVAAVTGFGLFVLLDNLYVEGLVHISELGSDYFQYDDRRHELRGERTGQVYRLTDRIRVRVARVDLDTSKIDFVLAPLGAPASTEPYSPPARNGDRRGNTRSRFASNAPVVEAPLAAQTPLASPAEAAVNQAVASVALAEPGKKRRSRDRNRNRNATRNANLAATSNAAVPAAATSTTPPANRSGRNSVKPKPVAAAVAAPAPKQKATRAERRARAAARAAQVNNEVLSAATPAPAVTEPPARPTTAAKSKTPAVSAQKTTTAPKAAAAKATAAKAAVAKPAVAAPEAASAKAKPAASKAASPKAKAQAAAPSTTKASATTAQQAASKAPAAKASKVTAAPAAATRAAKASPAAAPAATASSTKAAASPATPAAAKPTTRKASSAKPAVSKAGTAKAATPKAAPPKAKATAASTAPAPSGKTAAATSPAPAATARSRKKAQTAPDADVAAPTAAPRSRKKPPAAQ
ncbi:hypothetical protein JCM19000A_10470 [Silvimonas sp. JCM 19000]